jgi:hypothetical protein
VEQRGGGPGSALAVSSGGQIDFLGVTGQFPVEKTVTYRLIMFRPIALTVYIGLALAGVAMLLNFLAGGEGPPAAFVVFWLVALAWNGYGFLVRFAYEIGVVDGSILRWRSIMTSHEVPLVRVTGIRTWMPPFGLGVRRVMVEGDRSPILLTSPGFGDVVAMLAQFQPHLVIQTTRFDRLAERFSSRSFYWRRV